jgi:hypothetical protein
MKVSPDGVLVTATDCAGGADAPTLCENVRAAGEGALIVPEVNRKTTGMVTGLSRTAPAGPVAVTVTLPE